MNKKQAKQGINDLVVRFIAGEVTIQTIKTEIESVSAEAGLGAGDVILALIHAEKNEKSIVSREELPTQETLTDDQVKLIELIDNLLVGVQGKNNLVLLNGSPVLKIADQRRVHNLKEWVDGIAQSRAGCNDDATGDLLIEMGDRVEGICYGVEADSASGFGMAAFLGIEDLGLLELATQPLTQGHQAKPLEPVNCPFQVGDQVTVKD